jgi:hypothetical protein
MSYRDLARLRPLARAAMVGSLAIIVGSCAPPSPSLNSSCVAIAETEHVFDLTWINDGARLTIDAEVGLLASDSAGQESFWSMEWPPTEPTRLFAVDAHGSAVGNDGTIYLLESDGIWARSTAEGSNRQIVPIPFAERDVISWRLGKDAIFALQRATAGPTLIQYPLDGRAPSQVLGPDPDAFDIWVSSGETVFVVSRTKPDSTVEFQVHIDGRVEVVDSGESFPTFEWLTNDGRNAVFASQGHGLLVAPIDASAPATAATQGLPNDFNAVTSPTTKGVVAYSGRDGPGSRICFSAAFSHLLPM